LYRVLTSREIVIYFYYLIKKSLFYIIKKKLNVPQSNFNLVLCADDPYYCGLRARIPNFVKRKNGSKQEVDRMPHSVPMGGPPAMMAPSHHYMHSAYGVAPIQPWRPAPGYHEPGETSLTPCTTPYRFIQPL